MTQKDYYGSFTTSIFGILCICGDKDGEFTLFDQRSGRESEVFDHLPSIDDVDAFAHGIETVAHSAFGGK